MKTTTVARSIDDITVAYAEPVGQNTRQTIIIRERAVSKESSLTSILLLAAGVLFGLMVVKVMMLGLKERKLLVKLLQDFILLL